MCQVSNPTNFNFYQRFVVIILSNEGWLNDKITFTENSIVYFTDGSKFHSAQERPNSKKVLNYIFSEFDKFTLKIDKKVH